MQLKSLPTVLKYYFIKLFIFPMISLLVLLIFLILTFNINKKRMEDNAYIETIRVPLINSMLLMQSQESHILLNSISTYRGWKNAYLLNNENIVISSFPSTENYKIGSFIKENCNNVINKPSVIQICLYKCYYKNVWR